MSGVNYYLYHEAADKMGYEPTGLKILIACIWPIFWFLALLDSLDDI
jgi:hypothetical protein